MPYWSGREKYPPQGQEGGNMPPRARRGNMLLGVGG